MADVQVFKCANCGSDVPDDGELYYTEDHFCEQCTSMILSRLEEPSNLLLKKLQRKSFRR